MRALLATVALSCLVLAAPAQETSSYLDVLRNLEGDWRIIGPDGKPASEAGVRYRVTAGESVVAETLFPGTPKEMMTLYHQDGDALMLTHYCVAQNQPRMRLQPGSRPDRLEFSFADGTSLDPDVDTHMHSMTLTIEAPDRIHHAWTLWGKGEAVEVVEFSAVRAGATQPAATQPVEETRPLDPGHFAHFGAGVSDGPAIGLEELRAHPETFLDRDIRITGPVVAVCQNKGCWMRLGTEADNVFVRFKDYGFFVPMDTPPGATAVLEGRLSVVEQSVEEQQHYLEDAGKHEEAARITEPIQVLHFLATGVALPRTP